MAQRRRAHTVAFTCSIVVGAALAGSSPAMADPTDPAPTPAPAVIYPTDAPPPPPPLVSSNPMTPHQPPVPVAAAAPAPAPAAPPAAASADPGAVPAPADPGATPPPAPVTHPSVPEIPNAQYGSGNGGGGILGSIIDLWHQARNPSLDPSGAVGLGGSAAAPPPGAGPAPALPPGYVSTNAPGSETPATSNGPAGGPATGRPALPPGYYPTSGPPPPWYLDPAAAGSAPAAAPAPSS